MDSRDAKRASYVMDFIYNTIQIWNFMKLKSHSSARQSGANAKNCCWCKWVPLQLVLWKLCHSLDSNWIVSSFSGERRTFPVGSLCESLCSTTVSSVPKHICSTMLCSWTCRRKETPSLFHGIWKSLQSCSSFFPGAQLAKNNQSFLARIICHSALHSSGMWTRRIKMSWFSKQKLLEVY